MSDAQRCSGDGEGLEPWEALPEELAAPPLCLGPFEPADISVQVLEGEKTFAEDIVQAADKHWAELVALKPKCFDGPVWTVAGCDTESAGEEAKRSMLLRLQRSSYRFATYTHFSADALSLPAERRSNVIGVGALTFTSEGLLLVGRRAEHLAMMQGYWSFLPLGVLDEPSLQAVLRKESEEELGIRPDEDVRDLWCLGVFDCGREQGHALNAVFVQQLRLDAAALRSCYEAACDRSEHSEVRCLCPEEVVHLEPLTYVLSQAVRALLHVGASRPFGDEKQVL